jgi:uncharacterized membrane protein YeaQ/YmgE (transglycosylase-associated protein family)
MAQSPSDQRGPTLTIIQALAIASQFGITLVVAVVLGYLAGQWLDGQFRTGIIFTLIGVLLGLAGAATGTVGLYRATLRRGEEERSARQRGSDEGTR